MQIQVKCGCGGECREWTIIEVQGVVEVQPAFKELFQNLEIGQLCRPSTQETYTFTVGYHELTGSKVPLKKPLVVLKKILNDDTSELEGATHKSVELEVLGIIRQRILFKTRPRALISNMCFLTRTQYVACILQERSDKLTLYSRGSSVGTTSGGEEKKAVTNILTAVTSHRSKPNAELKVSCIWILLINSSDSALSPDNV